MLKSQNKIYQNVSRIASAALHGIHAFITVGETGPALAQGLNAHSHTAGGKPRADGKQALLQQLE